MIVLEVLGELDEVFGGSRSGQEGSMNTKCCTCQLFGASQEAASSPGPAPKNSGPAPSRLRGIPPEASRASLMIIVECFESLWCPEKIALDRHDQRSAGF